jgi:hypothetical protein
METTFKMCFDSKFSGFSIERFLLKNLTSFFLYHYLKFVSLENARIYRIEKNFDGIGLVQISLAGS